MPAPSEPSRPDRIRDLLRKLQALMDDPAASPAERDTARAKLQAAMARHNLTDADLLSEELMTVLFWYDHAADFPILCNVILETLGVSDLEVKAHTPFVKGLMLEASPADAADLTEAWNHYRPIVAAARKQAADQQRKLRKQAKAIGDGFARAFVAKFQIFPPRADTPLKTLTHQQIWNLLAAERAAGAAIGSVGGSKWQRKTGHIETSQPLQLT